MFYLWEIKMFAKLCAWSAVSLVIMVSMSACSTQPVSDEAIVRAEADCQVTGSNLKRKSTECATARRGAGVQDVSPEAIEGAKSKQGAKSTAGGG
jgi:hypothetical protein